MSAWTWRLFNHRLPQPLKDERTLTLVSCFSHAEVAEWRRRIPISRDSEGRPDAMSRQTTWVLTGALSIVALGGGTAVVAALGQNTDQDFGPAVEVSASPEPTQTPETTTAPSSSASPSPTITTPPSESSSSSAPQSTPQSTPQATPSQQTQQTQQPISPETISPISPQSWSAPSAPSS